MNRYNERSFLIILLLLVPVFTFGLYLIYNALNVPCNDDEGLLYTVNEIHRHPSHFFQELMAQHNDHRIFFSRLAGILIDLITGKLNFRIMIITGYLNLILLGYAFFLVFQSFAKNLLYFFPVAVLLFSPIVYATHIWSITAFEQTPAIAFSLFCLYFLQPDKHKNWYYSIPLAVAATLSNLDGLSVIPIAFVWLLVQRRKRESWIFGIFSISYLYLFFADYRFSNSSHFPHFPEIVPIVLKGFIAFSGSTVKVISDSHAYMLSLLLGAIILLTYTVFTITKFTRNVKWADSGFSISFAEICFLKLMACAAMIALGRAGDDEGSMFAVRFQIYSVSIFIVFYLFVLSRPEIRRYTRFVFQAFLCSAVVLNLLSYVKYKSAIALHYDQLAVDSYNFPNHSLFIHQYEKNSDPADTFYAHYDFPDIFKNELVTSWNKQIKDPETASQVTFKSKIAKGLPEYQECIYPVMNFEIGNLPSNVPRKGVYLALFSHNESGKPFLVALRQDNKGWFGELLPKKSAVNALSATFPSKIPGNYDVALCWSVGNVPNSLVVARNVKMP